MITTVRELGEELAGGSGADGVSKVLRDHEEGCEVPRGTMALRTELEGRGRKCGEGHAVEGRKCGGGVEKEC